MEIEKNEKLLKQFNYKFIRKRNKLIIKMGFSQTMTIDFTNSEKIVISNKLVGWNFLSGIIEMSLMNAILYNFIAVLLVTFLFAFIDFEIVGIKLIFIYVW
ncbi:MAG: hypothetical protein P8N27_04525, partial [Polaribacter sp.]|nr:hypothetical protein [Polaribacter sp.]